MIQIRGGVSSDMGVTVSDVTPLVLFIKPVPSSLSTRNKGLL